jgi:putative hydrolase of the HAD superfamily
LNSPNFTIDTIIFDFGGVLINIDYHLPPKAFKALGVEDFDRMYSKAGQSGLFDALEKGTISETHFYDEIRKISEKPLTDEAIKNAWNSILLDLPFRRLEMLAMLRKRYRVYLLSNTNIIHINAIQDSLSRSYGIDRLDSYFDKIFLSYEIGMRKPDVEIFKHVISTEGLQADKTLFIEDSPQHIEGAMKAGLHCIHHNTNDEPEAALRKFGISLFSPSF